jgi:hypothetical protein
MGPIAPTLEFEARYVRPAEGRALIVGSRIYQSKPDRRALYAEALGVDMLPGDGVDMVLDLEEPIPEGVGQFAHIECISVLEHSKRPWKLAENLQNLLVPRGTIHVQVPFVWRYHAYDHDYYRFTMDGVKALFPGIEWDQMMYAHESLSPKSNIPRVANKEGRIYLQRTEVVGFGRLA